MKRIVGMALAATVLVFIAAASSPDAEARWQVGPWSMDAFYSNGLFDHCSMWAEYNSGITLYFAQTNDYTLFIGMSDPSWVLDPNANYTMTLFIDNRAVRRARGHVLWGNRTRLWLNLGHDQQTRRLLRRRYQLSLSDGRNNYNFRLTGTSRGLIALQNCVSRFR